LRRFYVSPFPPEECRRRLEAATKPDTFYNRFFGKASEGVLADRVSETDCRLVAWVKRTGLPQVLYGQFAPTSDGSVIEIEFRRYPRSWVSPVILLTVLVLLGGKDWVLGVRQLLTGTRSLADSWVALLLLPFLLLVGALWLFDTEPGRKTLLEFVEDVLEAREIEPHVTKA